MLSKIANDLIITSGYINTMYSTVAGNFVISLNFANGAHFANGANFVDINY